MPSKKGANPFADVEFLRSYHQVLKDTEVECNVLCTAVVRPRERPVSIEVTFIAQDNVKGVAKEVIARYSATWPNATAMSFTAFLFRSSVAFGRLVADTRRDLWTASPPAKT